MSRKHEPVLAVDIGTTSITAVVAEADDEGVAVIGFSAQPSSSVKKGIIINMESTAEAIKAATEEVEVMTGIQARSAVVSISGTHIQGFCNTGVIPLTSKEVKKGDIQRVMQAAKSIVIPTERDVIQILPQEFVLDDQEGIRDPLGMSGVRLESRVYILTGSVGTVQNVVRCINRSGLKVRDIVVQPVASAAAALTEDEKELGCLLIDLGGGTTDMAAFHKGSIKFCSVLPLGGHLISSDIAIGLRTPLAEAEKLKKQYRHTDSPEAQERMLQVAGIGNGGVREVPERVLTEIIVARVEELFYLVRKELDKTGIGAHLRAGAILTGGTALLDGLCSIAEQKLAMPVRCGGPQGIHGIQDVKSPLHATAVGLAVGGAPQYKNRVSASDLGRHPLPMMNKMKQWFAEAF